MEAFGGIQACLSEIGTHSLGHSRRRASSCGLSSTASTDLDFTTFGVDPDTARTSAPRSLRKSSGRR